MAEETSELEKLTGIVPDIFYDIIARIVPGGALVIALGWDQNWHQELLGDESSIGAFMIFLGGAYIVGMLLTSISYLYDFTWKSVSETNWWKTLCTMGARRTEATNVLWHPVDLVRQMQRLSDSNAGLGRILFKGYAEFRTPNKTSQKPRVRVPC